MLKTFDPFNYPLVNGSTLISWEEFLEELENLVDQVEPNDRSKVLNVLSNFIVELEKE